MWYICFEFISTLLLLIQLWWILRIERRKLWLVLVNEYYQLFPRAIKVDIDCSNNISHTWSDLEFNPISLILTGSILIISNSNINIEISMVTLSQYWKDSSARGHEVQLVLSNFSLPSLGCCINSVWSIESPPDTPHSVSSCWLLVLNLFVSVKHMAI